MFKPIDPFRIPSHPDNEQSNLQPAISLTIYQNPLTTWLEEKKFLSFPLTPLPPTATPALSLARLLIICFSFLILTLVLLHEEASWIEFTFWGLPGVLDNWQFLGLVLEFIGQVLIVAYPWHKVVEKSTIRSRNFIWLWRSSSLQASSVLSYKSLS